METIYPRPASFECTFVMAPQCQHDTLFDAHYQRANRLNQTKILRCFPHCCPEHVPRSYCGSSVWLRVTQTTKDTASRDSRPPRLLVFARFRTNDSPAKISLNDPISLARVRASLQSETNTGGEWISSELVTSGGSKAQPSWLYEINTSRRWYYSWRSGKMSVRRLTAHVLEALVVADTGLSTSRVVAMTKSSPFTIVSFRRSRDTKHHETDRTLTVLEASLLERFLQPPSSPEQTRPAIRAHQPAMEDPYEDGASFRDDSLSSQLSMIFASADRVRLDQVSELLAAWRSPSPSSAHALKTTSRLSVLASFVWFVRTDNEIWAEFQDRTEHARLLLSDIHKLDETFVQWHRWLVATIEKRLVEGGLSWRELTAAAQTSGSWRPNETNSGRYCFDRESFIARARQSVVFEAKTRQLSRVQARQGITMTHNPRRIRAETVNGQWGCQLSQIAIVACDDSGSSSGRVTTPRTEDVSVSAAIAFYQQLGHLELRLDHATALLSLGSVSLEKKQQQVLLLPCRLVLDGRVRFFSCLPHGESTLTPSSALAGQCFGDYRAKIDSDGTVHIVCYSWPVDQWLGTSNGGDREQNVSSTAYRWAWMIGVDDHDAGALHLQLSVDVSLGFVSRGLKGGLQYLSASDRVKCIDRWTTSRKMVCRYNREPCVT